MTQQPSTPRRPVALAATFLVVASVSFIAAFYLLDGARYAQVLLDDVLAITLAPPSGEPSSTVTGGAGLVLPSGMPKEFALRLWQEQADSQQMIGLLVHGGVHALKIDRVEMDGDDARMLVTVKLTDGTTQPGVIGLKKFGSNWYVSYASAQTDRTKPADSPLPDIGDVDPQLLSTMLAEQSSSQSVIAEYLGGIVKEVAVTDVQRGLNTATIDVEMDETHGDGYATIVAIRSTDDERSSWFLSRFTKTGDATATAQ